MVGENSSSLLSELIKLRKIINYTEPPSRNIKSDYAKKLELDVEFYPNNGIGFEESGVGTTVVSIAPSVDLLMYSDETDLFENDIAE